RPGGGSDASGPAGPPCSRTRSGGVRGRALRAGGRAEDERAERLGQLLRPLGLVAEVDVGLGRGDDVEAGGRAGAVEDALVVGEEELTDRSSPGDLVNPTAPPPPGASPASRPPSPAGLPGRGPPGCPSGADEAPRTGGRTGRKHGALRVPLTRRAPDAPRSPHLVGHRGPRLPAPPHAGSFVALQTRGQVGAHDDARSMRTPRGNLRVTRLPSFYYVDSPIPAPGAGGRPGRGGRRG